MVGLLGGSIAVLASIPATPDGQLPVASLYRGIAESLTVGFVSFGLLAAAWMLVAVGGLRPGPLPLADPQCQPRD